jgi:hypothetical protein
MGCPELPAFPCAIAGPSRQQDMAQPASVGALAKAGVKKASTNDSTRTPTPKQRSVLRTEIR